MRWIAVAGLVLLAGCGGQGGPTGHNYSDPPPNAVIVATPTPTPTVAIPDAPADESEAPDNGDVVDGNAADQVEDSKS